jgi:ABC-type nickel/cobalt efflux system permease component RcnA
MILILWLTALVHAHPFGSSLYGHQTELWLDRDRVEVAYMAEIPTQVLLRDLRRSLAGKPSPGQAEQDAHTARWLEELQDGLKLHIDGQRVRWRRLEAENPSGLGGTRFIRYHLRLEATVPAGSTTLNLVNANLPDSPALYSTQVFVADGVTVDRSSLIDVDAHGEVEDDRSGAWRGEETARELRMSFQIRGAVGTALSQGYRRLLMDGEADLGEYLPARSRLSTVSPEILPTLVQGQLTPLGVVLALLIAVGLGALHAFSPGHGKALVAAYLLGERKTYRHAFMLGGIVTATHTITVFALGGVALALSETLSPEQLLPWLELASGLLVLGVGVGLVRSRRAITHDQDHDHDHDHDHADNHHDHMDEASHAAHHAQEMAAARRPTDIVALGISGGLAPCPSALVLLLTAISFHRIAFGLVLVFFFSLGLALLVTAVGLVVVRMGDKIRSVPRSGKLLRQLPLASAAFIVLIGLGITIRGVMSMINT